MTPGAENPIDTIRWQRLLALFDDLGDLPAAERAARLVELQAEDPALAQRLTAMLASDDSDSGLLDHSLQDLAPDLHAQLTGDQDDAAATDTRIGHYRLIRRIGSGGMGEVWLAERADGEYQQQVALKLLKRGMDTDAVLLRFRRERSILARLSHPNIVRLLDGGVSPDGRPYYVMEHVDGASVTRHANEQALDVRARVALIAVIADAVAHAHAQLVVHRDLKPSNVLVDASGMPHLLDFGIAKLLEESGEQTLTGTGMRLLSPAYASPEQIRGEPVGTGTDVYALGVLLFELLTGRLPHQRRSRDPDVLASGLTRETGERASQALAAVDDIQPLYGRPGDGRQLSRELAGDLDVIVAKALQPEPERRYPTVSAMADDLRRWLAGQAISARPDSLRYRTGKFVRRNKLAVAAAVLVLASLIGGLGAALWQAGIAREQAQRAEQQVRRTEQVKAFLIDLFRQNDPARNQGRSLTGEQMLERSQATLETRFRDDPDTLGELLIAIAEIRQALTDFDLALDHANRGIALLERTAQTGDPRLARAYAARAGVYAYTDRSTEAEADLRHARAIAELDPVGNADLINNIDQELASALRFTGSTGEAVELQRQVVARSLARHGADSVAVAEHRAVLALFLEEASEYVEAEDAYRLAVPVLEAAHGGPDPFLARTWTTFAGLLDRIGKREESAHYFERALAAQEQLFGRESFHYTRTLFSRGILLLSLRDFVGAEQDFQSVMDHYQDESNHAGHAARYLGRALLEQGRNDEAAERFQQAERIYRKVDNPGDLQRWRARADYGEALLRAGELPAARNAVEAAIAGMSELTEADDIHFFRPLNTLGQIARAEGDVAQALRHHHRWLDIAKKRIGEQSPEAKMATHQIIVDHIADGSDAALDQADVLAGSLIDAARASGSPLLDLYEDLPATIQAARKRLPASP